MLVLLPAKMIPDHATVSKRTGEYTMVLRHDLTVYVVKPDGPLKITGYFLVNERGDINQVTEETRLHWHVTAEELVDTLKNSWEINQ